MPVGRSPQSNQEGLSTGVFSSSPVHHPCIRPTLAGATTEFTAEPEAFRPGFSNPTTGPLRRLPWRDPARTEHAAVEPLLYRPSEGLPHIAADMLVRQGRTPEEVVAFLMHQTGAQAS